MDIARPRILQLVALPHPKLGTGFQFYKKSFNATLDVLIDRNYDACYMLTLSKASPVIHIRDINICDESIIRLLIASKYIKWVVSWV